MLHWFGVLAVGDALHHSAVFFRLLVPLNSARCHVTNKLHFLFPLCSRHGPEGRLCRVSCVVSSLWRGRSALCEALFFLLLSLSFLNKISRVYLLQ